MEYKSSLKGLFIFELKSWLGRKIKKTTPEIKSKENYLHLGCGNNIVNGYVNADFFYGFNILKKKLKKLEWQLDLRYPLDCEKETFDGIFSEHTLEHLYPDEAKNLLSEMFRVSKKGATIRITVPDIQKYVCFYNKDINGCNYDKFSEMYSTGCDAIRNITQNFFHFSAWDFEELKNYLENVGFTNVQKKEYGDSSNRKLLLDAEGRAWETLYVEAIK